MDHSQVESSSRWDVDKIIDDRNLTEQNIIGTLKKICQADSEAPAPPDVVPPQPLASLEATVPAAQPSVSTQELSDLGIVLAKVYGFDTDGLKDDPDSKDVKVGKEVIVVNPTRQDITVEQLQASVDILTRDGDLSLPQIKTGEGAKCTAVAKVAPFVAVDGVIVEEVLVVNPTGQDITVKQFQATEDIRITLDEDLLQQITGAKFTAAVATFAPFMAVPQPVNAETSPKAPTSARLVESALVPIATSIMFIWYVFVRLQ